jgi:hypothetical protein
MNNTYIVNSPVRPQHGIRLPNTEAELAEHQTGGASRIAEAVRAYSNGGGGVEQSATAPLATVAPLQATRETYPDRRGEEFGTHQEIVVTVKLPAAIPFHYLLTRCLGKEDARVLESNWGDRIKGYPLVETAKTSLFLNSNDKVRNDEFARESEKTTQAKDFENAQPRHQFASIIDATVVCATAVKMARAASLDLSP